MTPAGRRFRSEKKKMIISSKQAGGQHGRMMVARQLPRPAGSTTAPYLYPPAARGWLASSSWLSVATAGGHARRRLGGGGTSTTGDLSTSTPGRCALLPPYPTLHVLVDMLRSSSPPHHNRPQSPAIPAPSCSHAHTQRPIFPPCRLCVRCCYVLRRHCCEAKWTPICFLTAVT